MTKAERDFFEAARSVEKLYGEHFGYHPEYEYDDLDLLDDWYCMGPGCGQSFGKPHLDDCIVGTYRALLAEEEKCKGGDATNVPAECGSSREPAGISVARGASTGPVVERCQRCGHEHEPGYECGPVAEPKRGVDDVLNLLILRMESDKIIGPLVTNLCEEALRLYREERDGRK